MIKILLVLGLPLICQGHVSLTFPEARFPRLDFLDTVRTPSPCGVPKSSKSQRTPLFRNSVYTFTWAMSYVHQGAFKLQLLDKNGKLITDLTETGAFIGNQTQTGYAVQLPDRECKDCTVRLIRQANEWGDSYRFHSCADVDIISPSINNDWSYACSGNGIKVGSKKECHCRRRWTGPTCQYPADCKIDGDCAAGGKCVDNELKIPAKVCFCAKGRFGTNCEKVSTLSQRDQVCSNFYGNHSKRAYDKYGLFASGCYLKESLNGGQDFVFHRQIDTNTMEFVLDYDTDSWAAVGWRPTGLNEQTCQLFPIYAKTEEDISKQQELYLYSRQVVASSQYDEYYSSVEIAQPEPKAEPDTAAEDSDDNGHHPLISNSWQQYIKLENGEQKKAETEGSSAEPKSEPESASGKAASSAESEPEPHHEPAAEESPAPEAESEPTADAELQSEPEPEKKKNEKDDYARKQVRSENYETHAMNCMDVVIAEMKNGLQRVADYYTRDRSTPLEDRYYGGDNDLTAAFASKINGRTIVMFRKPILRSHLSDQTFNGKGSLLLWAKGATENGPIAYHGGNRGVKLLLDI